MKKLNITKEKFEKSRYFQKKYGTLKYVSESGNLFKTSKGQILKFNERMSARKKIQQLQSGELYQKQMPSLEKAIQKFIDSDGTKGQAGSWLLLSDDNGDITLYEDYGHRVGTITDGHMIWRDNDEYFVSEIYSNMILKCLYDGGLIDEYPLNESTRKFGKKFKEGSSDDLMSSGGKELYAEINIWPDDIRMWEDLMNEDKIDYDEYDFDEESTVFQETAQFADGCFADLKINTNDKDDGTLWAEVVLFDEDGHQLAYSEPSYDGITGDWELDANGKTYIVSVGSR